MDCFKDNAKETASSRDAVYEKDDENFVNEEEKYRTLQRLDVNCWKH